MSTNDMTDANAGAAIYINKTTNMTGAGAAIGTVVQVSSSSSSSSSAAAAGVRDDDNITVRSNDQYGRCQRYNRYQQYNPTTVALQVDGSDTQV